ncbi:Cell division ATP-binding protein FtsE [bacterium HR35]|nr:Cell division ATP-binding protein FtsE [bacterium HR35]
MIVFKNVTKIFNGYLKAVDNLSFEIKSGEFVILIGKSGAGKTTVLRLINKEIDPTRGEIYYKNLKITYLSSGKRRELRRKIITVFQDFKLLNKKTVYENLSLPLEILGKSKREIEKEVLRVAEKFNLKEKLEQLAETLSGGEKQKVVLARGILYNPEVILADEPTGNLDPLNSLEIIETLKKLNNEGITIVLATHNREVVNQLKTRVITLENGRIIKDENPGSYTLI